MPVITTVHDVMWLKHPEWARSAGWKGIVETAFYQHGIRRALKHAARIPTISQSSKDEIATIDREGGRADAGDDVRRLGRVATGDERGR